MAGIAIILLTNVIVFSGVAYNRSGVPESQISLTERELRLPFAYGMQSENTGISLRLLYRVKDSGKKGLRFYNYGYYSGDIDWLDEAKLASLGLDVTRVKTSDDNKYGVTGSRNRQETEVIFVLEYDGPAYQETLANAKEEDMQHEKNAAPRLFIIDAGLSQKTLRDKYPDKSNYILLKGIVGARFERLSKDSPGWVGYVKSLSNPQIHVPLAGHKVLEPLMAGSAHNRREDPPRFSVTLNIGKRLEPWVESVDRLGD